MKKLFYKTLMISSVFSLLSCEIKEKINLNADGSGDFSYNWNVNDKFLKDLIDSTATEEGKTTATDTVMIQKANWADYLDENLSKKAVKENKEFLNSFQQDLDAYTIKTVSSDGGKPNYVAVNRHFSTLSQIDNAPKVLMNYMILEEVKKGKKWNEEKDGSEQKALEFFSNAHSKYNFDGKTFSRTIDKEALAKVKEKTKSDSLGIEKGIEAMLSSMGSMLKYSVEYRFPRRIAESSHKEASYSLDGKTMKIEYNILNLISKPESLTFQVKLEE